MAAQNNNMNANFSAGGENNLNLDFQNSNFERRSRRLNTNLARTGPEAAPVVASEKVVSEPAKTIE
jgi:hypothetical protein